MDVDSIVGKHRIASLDDLQQLATQFARTLRAGDVIALHGDLGVGKTTFTTAVMAALGMAEGVSSPTYTIVHEYTLSDRADLHTIFHIDLYRFTDTSQQVGETAVYIRSLMEHSASDTAAVFVEWPEGLSEVNQYITWDISFSYGENQQERVIVLERKL